jgi:hypothetical protein
MPMAWRPRWWSSYYLPFNLSVLAPLRLRRLVALLFFDIFTIERFYWFFTSLRGQTV